MSFTVPMVRMYVDESGSATDSKSEADPERYLGVSGVIVTLPHSRDVLGPEIDRIKRRYCPRHHPDNPVPLHRKDVVSRYNHWNCGGNQDLHKQLCDELRDLISSTEMTVISVLIDKYRMSEQYAWPAHPYHYALEILLERYVKHLHSIGQVGDVMAESRGKPDMQLKAEYARLFEDGCDFASASEIQRVLTTKELKVKRKELCIPGLEMADLIAKPARQFSLKSRGVSIKTCDLDVDTMAILEESKFRRSSTGRIQGWGWVWKP